jgi:outer membrane protein assembly factor BamA
LLPIRSIGFVKKFNPRTSLGLAYNYQQRPDYTSTVLNFTFGYRWKTARFVTHVFNPLDLNFVKVPFISEDQRSRIEGTYLQYSFEDHMAAVVSYSYLFNNQNIKRRGDFQYFRLNLESAGNLTQTIHRWSGESKIEGYYQLFGVQYSQFVKGDVDYRFYQNLNEDQSMAYRVFLGTGFPYGNANALPFEKKYYSGGPNSVRGWLVRSLGPGSYIDSTPPRYPNASGDIKLEANLEYRFGLFWIMEGALFLDAGNIWSINRADDRKGALFEWNRFYKELALGTGLGFRFDLKFLIFRADIGVKLRPQRSAQSAMGPD